MIERTLDSVQLPCDMGGASSVKIRVSKNDVKVTQPPKHYGSKVATAELQLHVVQDLADHVDALREATAGHPLHIRVVVDRVNTVLPEVKAGWKAE